MARDDKWLAVFAKHKCHAFRRNIGLIIVVGCDSEVETRGE